MFRRFADSILTAVAIVFAAVVGIIVSTLVFILKIIPKRDEQARRDAEARLVEAQAALAAKSAVRATDTATKIDNIEKTAAGQKAEDSVDLANRFIVDEMK